MYIHNIPHLPTYAMNGKMLFYYKSKEREKLMIPSLSNMENIIE